MYTSNPPFPPRLLPYLDFALYILDARAPTSTLFLDPSTHNKEIFILNRADLADERITKSWHKYFDNLDYPTFITNASNGTGIDKMLEFLQKALVKKQADRLSRGIKHSVLRIVTLGLPNVGKSTLLNKLLPKKRFKTGDQPGITKGHQWVKILPDIELLDTPGIIKPLELKTKHKPLWRLLNLVHPDGPLNQQAAELLWETLDNHGQSKFMKLYKCQTLPEDYIDALEAIARKCGFFNRREHFDIDAAASTLVYDFHKSRLGRVSLEDPITSPPRSPLLRTITDNI